METLIVMPLSSVMAHINTRCLLCSSVDAYALWDPSKLLVNGLVLSESVTSPTVVMLVFNSILSLKIFQKLMLVQVKALH